MAALNDAGGKDYLVTVAKTDPRTFCALLGKILPTQVAGDAEAGPVRIEFSWLPPQSSGSLSLVARGGLDRRRRRCAWNRSETGG
jgi:hypothetical protein